MNILTIFVAKFKDRREEEVSDVEKLGPDAAYVPQESIVIEKSDAEVDHSYFPNKNSILLSVLFQMMSLTKALGILNFITARGLDNGERGALKLSNQVKPLA